MLEVARVLKLTLFSVRSLKSLTPTFSQIFPVTPIFFFKILTTGTKGSIIPKSEGVPDVRDKTKVLNTTLFLKMSNKEDSKDFEFMAEKSDFSPSKLVTFPSE